MLQMSLSFNKRHSPLASYLCGYPSLVMPREITLLDETLHFPPVETAVEGLLAVGGDLSPARLLAAYEAGIFPWYDEDSPPLWWSPEERAVLFLDDLKVSKSMRSTLRNGGKQQLHAGGHNAGDPRQRPPRLQLVDGVHHQEHRQTCRAYIYVCVYTHTYI